MRKPLHQTALNSLRREISGPEFWMLAIFDLFDGTTHAENIRLSISYSKGTSKYIAFLGIYLKRKRSLQNALYNFRFKDVLNTHMKC